MLARTTFAWQFPHFNTLSHAVRFSIRMRWSTDAYPGRTYHEYTCCAKVLTFAMFPLRPYRTGVVSASGFPGQSARFQCLDDEGGVGLWRNQALVVPAKAILG